MQQQPKRNLGFTLLELLITLAVVAVLSLFSTLAVATSLKKARDSKRKSELQRIYTALYDYYSDTNCFPDTLPACHQNFGSYLKDFPCDPQGSAYIYQTENEGCNQRFKILTNLENKQDLSIARVGCKAGCGPDCQYNYGLSSTNIRLNQGCVTYYACLPEGSCAALEDPAKSRCPRFFENDPTCGGAGACLERKDRCHDASGKNVPYIDEPTPTEKPPITKTPKK